jgi:hypothetical protein
MKYTLTEIKDGIFLVEFDNATDLAMTFLRYQEYYESPNPKFKGKKFTIIDFIEWYSKNNGDLFTYPRDWAGFNIPMNVVFEVQSSYPGNGPITDFNKYDELMKQIVLKIEKKKGNKGNGYRAIGKNYIIGTLKGKSDVMKHELAHGFYHVYPFYKTDMDKLYSKLSIKSKKELDSKFKAMGYHKSVWKDEAQAYLSTGEYLTPAERKPFVDLLNKFVTSKNNIS